VITVIFGLAGVVLETGFGGVHSAVCAALPVIFRMFGTWVNPPCTVRWQTTGGVPQRLCVDVIVETGSPPGSGGGMGHWEKHGMDTKSQWQGWDAECPIHEVTLGSSGLA
jgi:hypothetical protein